MQYTYTITTLHFAHTAIHTHTHTAINIVHIAPAHEVLSTTSHYPPTRPPTYCSGAKGSESPLTTPAAARQC